MRTYLSHVALPACLPVCAAVLAQWLYPACVPTQAIADMCWICSIIMPYIYNGMHTIHPSCIAWRVTYFVPGSCQILIALLVLFFAQVCFVHCLCSCLSCEHVLEELHRGQLKCVRLWCRICQTATTQS